MIIIDKLKKNFGEKIAVDIEHYEINQGDMLGLVGNNGAGKTTLFRIMLDLLKADDGKVIINDIDVSQSEDWKSITGAFIDDGFLIDYLTPEEYFYFIGKMYGLKKEEVDERLIPFERFMSGEVIGHKKLKDRNYFCHASLPAITDTGRTIQLSRSKFSVYHQTSAQEI